MIKPQNVADCMHSSPITVSADMNIAEATEIITSQKLTGVTVTNEAGEAIGVLSELDCLRGILSAIYNDGDPEHGLVSQYMTSKLNTCSPEQSIVEVAQDMLDSQQRRRPVIENGKLVGQVSSRNILWALMEYSRRKVQRERAE